MFSATKVAGSITKLEKKTCNVLAVFPVMVSAVSTVFTVRVPDVSVLVVICPELIVLA